MKIFNCDKYIGDELNAKILLLYIFFLLTFVWMSPPAEAVLGFLKRGFKHCTGECDNQSKVCNDPELAEWCSKNCNHKADKNGRIMNGRCFETITQNPQKNATRVTSDFAQKQLAQCNARVTESKSFSAFMQGIPNGSSKATVLGKLIHQLDGIVQDLGAPLSAKVDQVNKLTGKELEEYSGNLIAYTQGCNNLNNKISDFVYWSMGKIPPGGFKTVQSGSTKSQIDGIFEKVMRDNQR